MSKLTMAVAKKWVRKNAPSLLMAGGITCYGAGTGLAIYGTVKACKKAYSMPDATKKEVVKAVWPYYIPTLACFTGATALCITANHLQLTRIEILAAAYAANNKKLEVYKDRVKEFFGDDADKKISQEASRKRVFENPPPYDALPVGENVLHCQDSYTGQYFWSSRHKVDEAITEMDRAMIRNGQVTVNELLYAMGCAEAPAGNEVGWDGQAYAQLNKGMYKMPSEFIQLNYVKGPNGEPVLVVEYEPKVLLPFR